ncbi:MAG: hypothetical protein QXJ06_02085 [Candidatus Aenigmatarchaeota archaeon]
MTLNKGLYDFVASYFTDYKQRATSYFTDYKQRATSYFTDYKQRATSYFTGLTNSLASYVSNLAASESGQEETALAIILAILCAVTVTILLGGELVAGVVQKGIGPSLKEGFEGLQYIMSLTSN